MWRRVLQSVSLLCLAMLCLFYPVLESLDPWDSPEPSSDAEIQFIAVLTFVGIMFVLAHVLAIVAISAVFMQVVLYLKQRSKFALELLRGAFEPLVAGSPPLLPLRI